MIIFRNLWNTLKQITNHPLNQNHKIGAIIRFLKWQIGSRFVPGKVIFPWVGNTSFIVGPSEYGLTQNIYCGLQEFSDMAYVLHALNQEDIFIDVGANVGSYTILACGVKKAKGYCFEPIPETYLRLIENLKLNNLLDRVSAFNLGIADNDGELGFTSNKNTGNHIVVGDQDDFDIIKVKVASLDTILKNENPSLIKIDVEGYETLVIRGCLQTLKKPSLHSLIVETNGYGARHGFNEEELLDVIQSFGFHAYAYNPFSRALTPLLARSNTFGNTIFCRNESFIQERILNAPKFQVGGVEL